MLHIGSMRLALIVLWLVGCGGANHAPTELRSGGGKPTIQSSGDGQENASTSSGKREEAAATGTSRVYLPLQGAPARGANAPLVTIVLFSDVQCRFCRSAHANVERIIARYPQDVRYILMHNPLSFHPQALIAAEAAIEAQAQGGDEKFWSMYAALFEASNDLSREQLQQIALRLELDLVRFSRSLDSEAHRERVENDRATAQQHHLGSPPTLLLNGRPLIGAQPYERVEQTVREEIAHARQALGRGVDRARLYQYLAGQTRTEPTRTRSEGIERTGPVPQYELSVPAKVPSLGPSNAPVVIQLFSEFQCAFCAQARPIVDRLRAEFPNDVRVVFRHHPLPFHRHAGLAAQAAQEVFIQMGSETFWRFHDLVFEGRLDLSQEQLERTAAMVGADVRRLRVALAQHTHADRVRQDVEAVRDSGARIGSPSFFVNGTLVVGIQPYEVYADLVRASLPDTTQ